MRDSRETISARAFVAGYPIKHSRSPLIHGYWLSRYELEGVYEKIAVDPSDFAEFIATLKTSGSPYCGGNITIPHKEAACLLADEVDPSAEVARTVMLWLVAVSKSSAALTVTMPVPASIANNPPALSSSV